MCARVWIIAGPIHLAAAAALAATAAAAAVATAASQCQFPPLHQVVVGAGIRKWKEDEKVRRTKDITAVVLSYENDGDPFEPFWLVRSVGNHWEIGGIIESLWFRRTRRHGGRKSKSPWVSSHVPITEQAMITNGFSRAQHNSKYVFDRSQCYQSSMSQL